MHATKWRLIITSLALVIGLFQLTPWKDEAFDRYLLSQVKANKESFSKLLVQAQKDVQEKKFPH